MNKAAKVAKAKRIIQYVHGVVYDSVPDVTWGKSNTERARALESVWRTSLPTLLQIIDELASEE